MYNILFVCYGNICRSPMAEMIFKDLIIKNNKRYKFSCVSRATSMEELGNDIYPQAKRKLLEMGVTCEAHRATQMTKDDYNKYDYIIVMEERNKRDVIRIVGEDKDNKIHILFDIVNLDTNEYLDFGSLNVHLQTNLHHKYVSPLHILDQTSNQYSKQA